MAFISNHLPLAHSSLQPNYLCNKLPLHSSPCVLVCFWLQFWNKSPYQSFSMCLCYCVIQHQQCGGRRWSSDQGDTVRWKFCLPWSLLLIWRCERAKKALSTYAQLFLKTYCLLGDWKWTFKSPSRRKIFRNTVSVSYVCFEDRSYCQHCSILFSTLSVQCWEHICVSLHRCCCAIATQKTNTLHNADNKFDKTCSLFSELFHSCENDKNCSV